MSRRALQRRRQHEQAWLLSSGGTSTQRNLEGPSIGYPVEYPWGYPHSTWRERGHRHGERPARRLVHEAAVHEHERVGLRRNPGIPSTDIGYSEY